MTVTFETQPIRVFIVDDSPIIQDRLISLLGDVAGIEIVGQERTVAAAIKGVCRSRPDVLILDIQMPDGSGFDVLKSIQESDLAVTVVVLTNYPYPAYREKSLQLGASHFFDKSTEFDHILDVLAELRMELEDRSVSTK